MIRLKMNVINFEKMFIDMKLKINGKNNFSFNQNFILFHRLQGVKENVGDLQQRLHQYQKKNDEMHEKIGTLERKVSYLIFCETRSKRSIEVYKGKNLHPLPPHPPDVAMETSQTVTDIAWNMQLILYCYKVLQEKLISLWATWKALGRCRYNFA